MQNYIQQLFLEKIPRGKQGLNGWINYNCVCCVHCGHHKPDTRSRGGLKLDADGSIIINCFNCKFSTSWKPGSLLSTKIKNVLKWLACSSQEISKANFEALKLKEHAVFSNNNTTPAYSYTITNLPEGSKRLSEWANEEVDTKFLKVLEYISKRNPSYIHWFGDFYWSDKMPERLIIPMQHNNIIYGWTARLIREPKNKQEPRYDSSKTSKFLFGADSLFKKQRKFVILTEGPFDAIVVDGVACLGSSLNEQQLRLLKTTEKEIIVVPDKDKDGQKLIDIALENNWMVSFPEFGQGIKDISEAANKYGRLMTTKLVIEARESNPIKINILRKNWR